MNTQLEQELKAALSEMERDGLLKKERVFASSQGRSINVSDQVVLNFCANNYLGLSDNQQVIQAAKDAMDRWGYGLSSVRFICGTQAIHKELEKRISAFLHTDDTILFSSCFDANGALFEPLLSEEDAVISDELNHASIIDGIRLCKAKRYRYKHSDMESLRQILVESKGARRRLIATDGVFSMDGDIAKLQEICALAKANDALVMVDDSHATGYLGNGGRGTVELCNVEGQVDLITTTFGKACGGASGGCISGNQLLIDLYRQRARPYLFSNTLAPAICGGTLKVLDLLESGNPFKDITMRNARYFRSKMESEGFVLVKGENAIVTVMIYDEVKAFLMAEKLLSKGIYVIGFCYPVVPKGKARIRVQLSATHTLEDIDCAVEAFKSVAKEMDLL